MTLLDLWIPSYDVSATHTTRVDAAPACVFEIARGFDLGSAPLVRILMGLRALPAVVLRAGVGHAAPRKETVPARVSVGLGKMPFVILDQEPDREFVLGLMGRFWTPAGDLRSAAVEEFRSMPPPGLAQAIWNFRVEPDEGGCRLTTETRVRCADEPTRAQFLRYWQVVRFGSALTRRSMLRRIRVAAERAADRR
jgi:hypothetical protein